MKHFNSVGLKTKKPTNKFISWLFAEAGGFEPPVPLRVRQFSKLVVSATHPNFLEPAFSLKCGANIGGTFGLRKSFSKIFFTCFLMKEITCYVSNVKRIIFFENIFSHYSWEKTNTLLIIIEACGVIRFFTSVFAILRLSPWLLEKFIKKKSIKKGYLSQTANLFVNLKSNTMKNTLQIYGVL